MKDAVNVVVGTPIYHQGAYIIDKFLANQREIQQEYPLSELVLATNENDLVEELERLLSLCELRGRVIPYETVKPDYAQNRVWNAACGRETLRQYTLWQTEARYLLCLDADMTVDPSVIKIMEREIQGYDVVFSGCPLRDYGIGLAGAGCMMLTRDTLEKVKFRCLEFNNGEVMSEDNLLEMDLFRLGSRIKKGFFLQISHYRSEKEARHIAPQPVGVLRRITNSSLVRYGLIRASLMVKHNIPWKLKVLFNRFQTTGGKSGG
jgi:hypothetical protein